MKRITSAVIGGIAGFIIMSVSFNIAKAAEQTAFRQIKIPDTVGKRALNIALWYPTTDQDKPAIFGENQVFLGIQALKDAVPDTKSHPLVVLSHGYGGSWRNLNWLAPELVGHGYIVAAPDHPGTTTFNRDAEQAALLWERPHDLSRVIYALLADSSLAGKVEPQRIAAIGHSLGGWSVMALAGAKFDVQRFEKDCKDQPNPRTCGLAKELGMTADSSEKLANMSADNRVAAIVSLDLGLARGFTTESLAAIRVPALVLGAGVDIGDLPSNMESGYVAKNLPVANTDYVTIADAAHFSFMQTCKKGAVEMIEAENPGDGIICKDGGKRDREAIHREVADRIIPFLAKAMPVK